MHNSSSFIGSVVNIIIIFAILKFVMTKFKKNKNPGQVQNKDRFDKFLGKDIQSTNVPNEKPLDKETRSYTIPPENRLKYENKLTDRDKLQLKRCSNCGGEIPMTMMKCTICGQRQAGCGWVAAILIILIAFVIVMAVAKDSGIPIMYYLQQIFHF